ncbi:hypothetical protein OPV22_020775 [Ensete ventricosum]|uniref:Uncharacterized protein n=1 Tax=Ensete ventricosum TaxID=4639 RepID=A0AAV8QJQ1_ENSVE|nr:hypothetical protein OPV22_020775 [Ensete ventricosum]
MPPRGRGLVFTASMLNRATVPSLGWELAFQNPVHLTSKSYVARACLVGPLPSCQLEEMTDPLAPPQLPSAMLLAPVPMAMAMPLPQVMPVEGLEELIALLLGQHV